LLFPIHRKSLQIFTACREAKVLDE
jgi:hypothetical protein